MTPNRKLGKIAFVYDERLSRQKTVALTRVINTIRQVAEVQLVKGGIAEEELLQALEKTAPHLIMAPWYRYLSWSKIEGFYGLARNSGPTFAGYHFGQLLPYEIGAQADHLRTILLDFARSSLSEIVLLIRALILDSNRSGLKPLLGANAPVHYENWYDQLGLGNRIDAVLSLPEIARSDWRERSGVLHIALGALWRLVYEDGPGKSEFQQSISGSTPKAYFQFGATESCLALRLVYNMPSWSPKDVLSYFWPNPAAPASASQLLLKYTDFLRVHRVSETSDIEVVAGYLKSGVANRYPEEVHTFWVEPLKASLIVEEPLAEAGPKHPNLRPLPMAMPSPEAKSRAAEESELAASLKAKERHLQEALAQIRELKKALKERDELIHELRAGGMGRAQTLPPPDAESLLEAFQERYFDAKFQLREFEMKFGSIQRGGGTLDEVALLRQRMQALAKRQEGWIRTLAETLKAYQEDRKRVGKVS